MTLTPASATALTWCLITLALVPLVFACVLQWQGRTRSRALMLDPRRTNYGGTFMEEPSIDFDALERGL